MQHIYNRKNAGTTTATATTTRSDIPINNNTSNNNQPTLPTISLPKGGGAIRGIGEKFGANPVTGTASVSVPIFTSLGRSGFGPSLSLSYDSGSGNGPFGFGWNLSVPSIARKTDKGLPLYQDTEEESDTFILSGSEDLVPQLIEEEAEGQWQRHSFVRIVDGIKYNIQRYRPRIEGLFARIERWTNTSTGEIHWRSISKDNISTLYGKTAESRISDPDDPLRTFSWLICKSYDDKGNAIIYEYLPEDSAGVDLSAAHEKNRSEKSRSANRYLKRIKYGNKTSRLINPDLSTQSWMFEVVFDYGEHDLDKSKPKDSGKKWLCRHDPFSSYRAGFEIRTYRLCQRVLMFHHFPEELGTDDYLVRSTDFAYSENPIGSFITSVTQSGYVLRSDNNDDESSDGGSSSISYLKKSLPPLEFEYSKATIHEDIKEIDTESLENLPSGLDGTNYQWVDLDGEGVSGILTEQAGAWFYKRNLSSLPVAGMKGNNNDVDSGAATDGGSSSNVASAAITARFAPIERLNDAPSPGNIGSGGGSIGQGQQRQQQLLDLSGDGQLDVVQFGDPVSGFFERTTDERWIMFKPFASLPNIDWNDPNLRFVDLTGDGHADILITQDESFIWYPSLAEEGFAEGKRVINNNNQEQQLLLHHFCSIFYE